MRRELFDNVLFQHARSLSAVTVVEGFTFSDFLCDGGHIAGLVGTDDQGRQRRYGASIVIGADGAMSRVAEMAGAYDFGHKHDQHGIAAFRIYFRGVGGLTDTMEIHLLDELLPGYFWIFPVGAGRPTSAPEWSSRRCKVARAVQRSICASGPIRCSPHTRGCVIGSPVRAKWMAASVAGSCHAGASAGRWRAPAGC